MMPWTFRFFWFLAFLHTLGSAMFSKRPLPNIENVVASKRLRENLVDLFASNIVSADRASSLFRDSHDAGAQNVKDLVMKKGSRNTSRGLRSKLLRRSAWPGLYNAKVRLFNPKLQRITWQWLPMLLPHELLAALVKVNDLETIASTAAAATCTSDRIKTLAQEHNIPNLIGFGLWGDGVPANWDRTESYEILSMNLPSLQNCGFL